MISILTLLNQLYQICNIVYNKLIYFCFFTNILMIVIILFFHSAVSATYFIAVNICKNVIFISCINKKRLKKEKNKLK